MPTINYFRLWCRACKDYQLHTQEWGKKTYICKECNSEFVEIPLSKIPVEKIMQQRKRYTAGLKTFQMGDYIFGNHSGTNRMFKPVGSDFVVHEDDAGQAAIDETNNEKAEAEYQQRRAERKKSEAEATRYAKLGRNDICICGSGKKYKKCCMNKIKSYNL